MAITIVEELPDSQGRRSGWSPLPGTAVATLREQHPFDVPRPLHMPPGADLRQHMPPAYNQGPLNACTSHTVAAMLCCLRIRQLLPRMLPSRRFMYWYQRLAAGQQTQNASCTIVSAFNATSQNGYCSEHLFPYNDLYAQPPPVIAVNAAAPHGIGQFKPVANLEELKLALAHGLPVAMGFLYVNSFFQADNNGGHVPNPAPAPAVAHAALIVGYSDVAQTVTLRNSWGVTRPNGGPCGDAGHYYLPYSYICNPLFCKEFWVLPAVIEQA